MRAVRLAAAPAMVRGYESVKMRSIAGYDSLFSEILQGHVTASQ